MPYSAPKIEAAPFVNQDRQYYLQALAAQSNNPVSGALSYGALRDAGMRGNNMDGYTALMQSNMANQLAGADQENQADIAKAAITADAPNATAGIAGIRQFDGNQYLPSINGNMATTANQSVVNKRAAEAYKDFGTTDVALMEAGAQIPEQVLGQHIAGPEAAPVKTGFDFITPKNAVAQQEADAKTLAANASMVAAKKPPAPASDGTSYSYTENIGGKDVTVRTKTPPKMIDKSKGGGQQIPPHIAAQISARQEKYPGTVWGPNATMTGVVRTK